MGWYTDSRVEYKNKHREPAWTERVRPSRSKKDKPWRVQVGWDEVGTRGFTIGYYRTEQIAKKVVEDYKRKRFWRTWTHYYIDRVK